MRIIAVVFFVVSVYYIFTCRAVYRIFALTCYYQIGGVFVFFIEFVVHLIVSIYGVVTATPV